MTRNPPNGPSRPLGIASIVMTFIEPDSAIGWTDENLAEIRAALMSGDWLGS